VDSMKTAASRFENSAQFSFCYLNFVLEYMLPKSPL